MGRGGGGTSRCLGVLSVILVFLVQLRVRTGAVTREVGSEIPAFGSETG